MDFFINSFQVVLYQPLLNALILLYEYIPGRDFGVAVIALTLLIRIALYPLSMQSIKSQKAMQDIQPKLREVKEKFSGDKEKQMQATMELYKKEKVNPISGCLPLLIQLPILFAIFRVFWKGVEPEQFSFLYSFVPNPGQIDTTFLGMLNLAEASVALAFLTGIAQFFQTKMITPSARSGQAAKKGPSDFSSIMQKQMLYFFPIFTVFILWRLPSAIALYWLVTTLFTIGQQYVILRKNADPKRHQNN